MYGQRAVATQLRDNDLVIVGLRGRMYRMHTRKCLKYIEVRDVLDIVCCSHIERTLCTARIEGCLFHKQTGQLPN
jgi:hypothetical protein